MKPHVAVSLLAMGLGGCAVCAADYGDRPEPAEQASAPRAVPLPPQAAPAPQEKPEPDPAINAQRNKTQSM